MTSESLKINGTFRKHLKRNVPSSTIGKRNETNGVAVNKAVTVPDLKLDLENTGDIDFCEELERILQENEDPIHGIQLGSTQTNFIDDLFDLNLLSICENVHTYESYTMDSDVQVVEQEEFTLDDIINL